MLNFFKKIFNTQELIVIREPEYNGDGYFGSVNLKNIILKYKHTRIYYQELADKLIKYLSLPDDIELIWNIIDKKIFPIVIDDNSNRIYDYKEIYNFMKRYNVKEYFRDWVKQTEHPEIKSFAWLLAEKGILLKKKEKNRVYYKYNENADVSLIFKELFEAKDRAIKVYVVDRLIETIADKEANYIKIENTLNGKYLGIYEKLNTPLISGCFYEKCYIKPQSLKSIKPFKKIRDVLDEIVKEKGLFS